MSSVNKPSFIIGCPRSGTTIFMDILSLHPNLSWPSIYINRFPFCPQLAFLSRVWDIPIFKKFLRMHARARKMRLIPKPVEAWDFFRYLDVNFLPLDLSSPNMQVELKPPSMDVAIKFNRVINLLQKYQGKDRFVAKYTNKPRIIYLNSIFPDAIFIHIIRDGKAVVNSLYNKMRTEGWFSRIGRENWIKSFPLKYQEIITESFDPIIAFLTCYYCHIINCINKQLFSIPSKRFRVIKYEDFIAFPFDVFKEVINVLELPWTKDYEKHISFRVSELKNMDYKYRENLSKKQINIIDGILTTLRPRVTS